jgi:hypothetical protein
MEQIVGFDAREMWQDFNSSWPSSRKESLIRQDITKPLSTQQYVWPSVFDILDRLENGAITMYKDSRLKSPKWTGILGLWEDLSILQDALNAGWGQEWEPCWLIAITVLPQTFSADEQGDWAAHLRPTVPATPDETWQFLGYDVSDGSLLSGLMGCGHPDSDKAYVSYLNTYHLFTDLDQALKYKEEMNVGNKQHAPFFVYGLHLILDASAGKTRLKMSHGHA